MEIWNTIYVAPHYEVSNKGRIRNKQSKYILKTKPTPSHRHPQVFLCDGLWGKMQLTVSHLVYNAFNGCTNLTSVTLPSTVTEIGHISAISSEDLVIEYAGTAEDFAKIQMDEQTAALLLPYLQFSVSE